MAGDLAMKGILSNYPHVIAVVSRVMSEEDAETHPLAAMVLSNQEAAMDLRRSAVRGNNAVTVPPCFGRIKGWFSLVMES